MNATRKQTWSSAIASLPTWSSVSRQWIRQTPAEHGLDRSLATVLLLALEHNSYNDMYLVYTTVLYLGALLLFPAYLYQALRHRKYLGTVKYRMGWVPQVSPSDHPRLWVHAVSVGETLAVIPFVKRLGRMAPEYELVFSTTTATGQALARERLAHMADVIYFPMDFPGSVRRVLESVNPNLVVLVETEIWPNFLRACRQRAIPVVLVNGRISQGSFKGYRRAIRFIKPILNQFDLMLMQSPADAERALELGADPDRVVVTGNVKYDLDPAVDPSRVAELVSRFGLERRRLIAAGSTSRGEESILLEAYQKLVRTPGRGDVRLLIAPRHPERFDEVADLMALTGLRVDRRSVPAGNNQDPQAILLDSMGELATVYSVADVVFVGGSLFPVGGHNILEPAFFSKPVIVGPHMENFDAIIKNFLSHDAVVQLPVSTESAYSGLLAETFERLLNNREEAQRLGENANRLVIQNSGATDRTLTVVARLLCPAADRTRDETS